MWSPIRVLDLAHTRIPCTNSCTTSSHSVSTHRERERQNMTWCPWMEKQSEVLVVGSTHLFVHCQPELDLEISSRNRPDLILLLTNVPSFTLASLTLFLTIFVPSSENMCGFVCYISPICFFFYGGLHRFGSPTPPNPPVSYFKIKSSTLIRCRCFPHSLSLDAPLFIINNDPSVLTTSFRFFSLS
jgi:hypothetical protein